MIIRLQILLIVLIGSVYLAHGFRFRQKRLSDSRLAELETMIGLQKLNSNLKKIPYGFGTRDPAKLGRKRRTTNTLLDRILEQIEEENRNYNDNYI